MNSKQLQHYFNWRVVTPAQSATRSSKLAVSEVLESRTFLNATLTSPITSPVLPFHDEEVIKLSNHFDNPGGTGALTYTATNNNRLLQVSVFTTGIYSGDLLLLPVNVFTAVRIPVTVKATDSGGHSASTTFQVTIGNNTAILAFTSPSYGTVTNSPEQTLSGTAATGSGYSSSIEIQLNGTDIAHATASDGKFSIKLSSPLSADGSYSLFAIQSETSGDAIGATDSFYIDTTKPTATFIPPATITTENYATDGVEVLFADAASTLVADSITSDTISITGPNGQPIPVSTFTDAGTLSGSVDAYYLIVAPDANGEWTSALNGTYSVKLNGGVMDAAGNTLDPVADFGSFVVDIPPALPPKLTGTTIGTPGSYQNDGNTIAKATDGNLSTFFDGPAASGNWVGLDLGSSGGIVTDIAYASRSGWASRMNGGIFQAGDSSTFASGVVNLYTIPSNANPSSTVLTTQAISNTKAYRYYRYLSPAGSYGDVAEVQFFGTAGGLGGTTKLTGTTIGTSGSYQNDGNTIARATDGNLSTFFDGPGSNGNWVGLDLGSAKTIKQIDYAPRSGWASRMVGGEFQVSTTANFSSGVTTIYTITAAPLTGSLTTVTLADPVTARYIRYLSPNGSYGDISEFQVFG